MLEGTYDGCKIILSRIEGLGDLSLNFSWKSNCKLSIYISVAGHILYVMFQIHANNTLQSHKWIRLKPSCDLTKCCIPKAYGEPTVSGG